jgi:hypothetical protein
MSTPEGAVPSAAGHETGDVRVRPLFVIAGALAAFIALCAVLMLLLFGYLARREARTAAPVSPLAGIYGRKEPPEPRLQAHPADDLRALHDAESAALGETAWIDEDAGIMRIPIERAIDLLAERGLPARAEREAPR